MAAFIIRRLVQSVFTIFGVMLLTFLLFRVVAGDVSANYVSAKLGKEARAAWMANHGLDKPAIINPACRVEFWRQEFWDTQFSRHLWECATFSGRSYATDETLIDIIREKARYSLSITVPSLAMGWAGAMVVSCLVAYFRGNWIDRAGVFLSVLGMCIPYLAYMIVGQWLAFQAYPPMAWGLRYKLNIYVPVLISVVAGLGSHVRFYRTIILDEVHRDYVRTALAKGVPLPSILFKHVLKNCMLPILTDLVLTIPFLIMGAMLLERFFGIHGLGDLIISSVSARDVPIITALTFLTAVIYTVGLLVTDILYCVFDPRIRLR
jgi:peptide/nickel transport system permease protein